MRLKTPAVSSLLVISAAAFNQIQPTPFRDGMCSLDKNEKMSFKTSDGFTECTPKSCPPDKYNDDYPQCHYCCDNQKYSKGAAEGMVQKRVLYCSLVMNAILLILLAYPAYLLCLWLRAKCKKKHVEDHLLAELLPQQSPPPPTPLPPPPTPLPPPTPPQQSAPMPTPPQLSTPTPTPPLQQQQQQTTSIKDLDGAVSGENYIVEITDSDEDNLQNIENSVTNRYVQPFTDSFDSNEGSYIAITSEFV